MKLGAPSYRALHCAGWVALVGGDDGSNSTTTMGAAASHPGKSADVRSKCSAPCESDRKVAVQSEGEYVLDTSKARSNVFYNFSELTLAPLEWLRFGLATQRTRVYRSELDIQRGLIVGLSLERLSISASVYDVGSTAPMIVLAAGVDF
jgi:hypothetical protein